MTEKKETKINWYQAHIGISLQQWNNVMDLWAKLNIYQ